MTTFVSFERMLDQSFPAKCTVEHRCLTGAEAAAIINQGVEVAIDREEIGQLMADMLSCMFGPELKFRNQPPAVSLGPGDRLLVICLNSRLPKSPSRAHIQAANFRYGLWTIGEVDFGHGAW